MYRCATPCLWKCSHLGRDTRTGALLHLPSFLSLHLQNSLPRRRPQISLLRGILSAGVVCLPPSHPALSTASSVSGSSSVLPHGQRCERCSRSFSCWSGAPSMTGGWLFSRWSLAEPRTGAWQRADKCKHSAAVASGVCTGHRACWGEGKDKSVPVPCPPGLPGLCSVLDINPCSNPFSDQHCAREEKSVPTVADP